MRILGNAITNLDYLQKRITKADFVGVITNLYLKKRTLGVEALYDFYTIIAT